MLKSVNGFILEKYCRWSHTDKKKDEFIFVFNVYLCDDDICGCFCEECFVVYSLCHTFMTSNNGCHHVAFYHLSHSVKFTFKIMVMILSWAVSSLSVSVCRNSVWICFQIMDLCILLKICWIKISKLKGFCFHFFIINLRGFFFFFFLKLA